MIAPAMDPDFERRASEHLRRSPTQQGGGGPDTWQAELEELMLLEAIRLSLSEGQQAGGEGGGHADDDDDDDDDDDEEEEEREQVGAFAAQLAAQVERSIMGPGGGRGGSASTSMGREAGSSLVPLEACALRKPPTPAVTDWVSKAGDIMIMVGRRGL